MMMCSCNELGLNFGVANAPLFLVMARVTAGRVGKSRARRDLPLAADWPLNPATAAFEQRGTGANAV